MGCVDDGKGQETMSISWTRSGGAVSDAVVAVGEDVDLAGFHENKKRSVKNTFEGCVFRVPVAGVDVVVVVCKR